MADRKTAFTAGIGAVTPILLGVVPFALIAGIAAVDAGLSGLQALGMSLIVFAGAAQLAAVDLIGRQAPIAVVVGTALIINLRFFMYSASLAPHFSGLPRRWRSLLAYLLTDQAFVVSIAAYERREPIAKHWYYLGAAVTLWVVWQVGTAVGIFLGARVPAAWSLDFAIPLTFLALLFPTIRSRPAAVAAVVAGLLALISHGLPYNLGLFIAAIGGVLAGCLADWRLSRAA